MAGVTFPTNSYIPYDSVDLLWEERTVIFTATSSSHTIKFLPEDDDSNDTFSIANGSLRMGIDLISIQQGAILASSILNSKSSITIYPNPTSDNIRIEFEHFIEKSSILIVDINGRVMMNPYKTKVIEFR